MTRPHKIQQYLKIPYHILKIPDIGLEEKVLLAYIYGFGSKGCWQSNQTLATLFTTGSHTIMRWLANIKYYIKIENPRGPKRRLWAISFYPMKSNNIAKNVQRPQQNCSGNLNKTVERPKQNCSTYYNSIREITTDSPQGVNPESTIASPCPSPGEGGSAATPEERKSSPIEHLTCAIGGNNVRTHLSEEKFRQRKEEMFEKLLGPNWREKLDEIKNRDFYESRKKRNVH